MTGKPTSWKGARIREARLAADLKQRELAALLGVHKDSVSGWETGKHSPDGKTPKLEEVLGVDLTHETVEKRPAELTLQAALDSLRDAERGLDEARTIIRHVIAQALED